MFPARYCQASLLHPPVVGSPEFGTVQWFSFSGPLPTGFSNNLLAQDMADWWMNGIGALQKQGYVIPTWYTPCVVWIDDGSGATTGFAYSTIVSPSGDTLPGTQAVVVRRYTATAGRSGLGRIYVPSIDPSQCVGSYLSGTAYLSWEAAVAQMMPDVVSQGVNFTPSLVSWKNATLTPIKHWSVNGRIGHRRHRRLGSSAPIPFGTFTPPP